VKKFEFPLDRVAKWSQQKLTLEQLSLQRLIKEMVEVDRQLQDLETKSEDGKSTFQTRDVMSGHELQTLARFVQRLALERAQLNRLRQTLVAKIDSQRIRVVAEHRQVKLFGNLHDRRRQEWIQDLTKEEEALASDLFLAKLARDLRQTQLSSHT
jgi:flagellar export protein FliJ